MRVLYVIDSLVPAGAERSLAAITPHLVAAGVDLHVVALLDRPGLEAQLRSGGAVVHPPIGAVRRRALGPLSALVAATGPDLVHTTLFEADVAGRLASARHRVACVTTLASVGPDPDFGGPSVRARLLAARALDACTARLVRRFHAVSEAVATRMARQLLVARRRIDVVFRGPDARALGVRTAGRRQLTRDALGLAPDAPVALAVARHSRQKGLDVLVAARPEVRRGVPGAVLVVAGRSGEATVALHAEAARLGVDDSIRFIGPRDDVPDLLAATDAFVLPSRWEGLPGVLLEALALEAPVVASDIPEVREALGDPAVAVLVRPGSADELARAVTTVLLDPGTRAAAAAAGRRRFLDTFTVERSAEGMLGFYRRSLDARR